MSDRETANAAAPAVPPADDAVAPFGGAAAPAVQAAGGPVGRFGKAAAPTAPTARVVVDPVVAHVLETLAGWSEDGRIRRLDRAFGAFMVELCADASPTVVLAAALVAHMEGRGHTCLPLDALLERGEDVLGWPADAMAALRELLARLPAGFEAWLAELRSSPVVRVEGETAPEGGQPLVLRGSLLYLRRYWGHERSLAARLLERSAAQDDAAVDEVAARRWLDLLFPPPPQAQPSPAAAQASIADAAAASSAIDWQKAACAIALRGRISVITGGPGTGKTYCAARLLALLFALAAEPARLRIALSAPTGKAAARLRQSIEASLGELQQRLGDTLPLRELAANIGTARTLHALLGASPETRRFRFDALHPLDIDVLIVDEASMIHLEMMAALLEALPPQARVVFLGDKDQLASVEAGAVLGDLCRDAERGGYTAQTARYVEALTGQAIPEAFLRAKPQAGMPALHASPAAPFAPSAHSAPSTPSTPSARSALSAPSEPWAPSALAQQTVMLRESRRFGGPIGRLALAVNRGDARAAVELLAPRRAGRPTQAQPLHWIEARSPAAVISLALDGRDGAEGGYRAYLEAVRRRPAAGGPEAHAAWVRDVLTAFERFRVLCAVRDGDWGVAGLNAAIERALAAEGLLTKRGEWYEGRPVMVTRNDYATGVFNGDIAIALRPEVAAPGTAAASPGPAAPLRAWLLDGDAVRSVAVSRLADVETAFAMTVHKSQGSEFEHTVLVLPPEGGRMLARELVYTGITRARQAFTLVAGRTQAFAEALEQRTRRFSGLPGLLASAGEFDRRAD